MEWDDCEKFIGAFDTTAFYADMMRASAKTDDLHLYWIINTAGKKQFVIAKEGKLARVLSAKSGHIRERANGEIYRAASKFYEMNPGFGSSVRRAMNDRVPSVVQRKGEHAVVGDTVYSPLHGV